MVTKTILAYLMAAVSLIQRANYWAGEQLLKCFDEIHEFGLDHKVEFTAKRLARGGTDRGQLGLQTVLAAFVLVIAVSVTIIVLDTFDSSLGTPADSNLSDAQSSTLSGFADMASLIAPLLLIAIGVVIIGLIRRVQ